MNWDLIAVAGITAVPPTLVAAAAFYQARQTHKSVNSRMAELLALAKKASADEATLIEKAAETSRQKSKAKNK